MASDVSSPAPAPAELVGATEVFAKTVGESDITLFSAVTGDFHPNHVDDQYGVRAGLGGRVIHGALLVGLMSAACARLFERLGQPGLSSGYDRVRFTHPVRPGDTLTTTYRIVAVDADRARAEAEVQVFNQHGTGVGFAVHITHLTSKETS